MSSIQSGRPGKEAAPANAAPQNENALQQFVIVGLFMAFATAFSWSALRTENLNDFLPLWLAAKFFAMGQESAIYAKDTAYFTMSPPPEWVALLRASGSEASIYPYVYPPLWAKLLAPLTNVFTFAQATQFLTLLNPVLLIGTIYLAWRAAPKIPLLFHMLAGTALILGTTVGLTPIAVGQMHILVGFLMVLAMERSRNGSPKAAGVALAIAAAFKLFPLVFVIFFIAKRQTSALVSFACTGAALGLASLLLAGWPLHAEFLSQISAVSRTMLFVNPSINIDGIIGHLIGFEDAITIDQGARHVVLEKGPVWIWASRILMIGTVAALGIISWRNQRVADHPLIWATGFLAFALVSPLSWTFYYIAPLCMAPYLITSLGIKRAAAFFIYVLISLSLLMIKIPVGLFGIYFPLQIYGTFAMIALLIAYVFTIYRETRA
ncbi:MAG: hypothetical protein ACJA06_000584 [Halocynthiibacter sp.]|jgi:alpha-1,2-mannosyltransferase